MGSLPPSGRPIAQRLWPGLVGHAALGFQEGGATLSNLCLSPPQNCQTFSSLSCLSSGMEDRSPRSPFALHVSSTRSWTALLSASASGPGGRTPAGTPVPEPLPPSFDDHLACREELCCEEPEGCGLDEACGRRGEPALAWRDRGAAGSSPCSLDGELDIEQIENN